MGPLLTHSQAGLSQVRWRHFRSRRFVSSDPALDMGLEQAGRSFSVSGVWVTPFCCGPGVCKAHRLGSVCQCRLESSHVCSMVKRRERGVSYQTFRRNAVPLTAGCLKQGSARMMELSLREGLLTPHLPQVHSGTQTFIPTTPPRGAKTCFRDDERGLSESLVQEHRAGRVAPLVGPCPSHTPKGCRSDSRSGRTPRLRVRSQVTVNTGGNRSRFLSHMDVPLLFLLSLKIHGSITELVRDR